MTSSIKRIRESKGLSQKEVAALLEMPVRRYGSYERGERTLSLDVAARIADVFDVTLDELMSRDFKNATVTDKYEAQILDIMHQMNNAGKDALIATARGLAERFPKSNPFRNHKTA